MHLPQTAESFHSELQCIGDELGAGIGWTAAKHHACMTMNPSQRSLTEVGGGGKNTLYLQYRRFLVECRTWKSDGTRTQPIRLVRPLMRWDEGSVKHSSGVSGSNKLSVLYLVGDLDLR